MHTVFYANWKTRHKMLSKIRNNNKKWMIRKYVFIITNILVFLFLLCCIIYAFLNCYSFTEGLFFVITMCFPASIVWAIGYAIWALGKYPCGLPYSSRVNEQLVLTPQGLEYNYSPARKNDSRSHSVINMFLIEEISTFFIPKSNIKDFYIDTSNNICYIQGIGTLKDLYEDAPQKLGVFSFLIDFNNPNAETIISDYINN